MLGAFPNISAFGLSHLSQVQASARIADASATTSERVADIEKQSWQGPTTAGLAAKISPGLAWVLSELHTANEILSTKGIKSVWPAAAFAGSALTEFKLHIDDPTYIPAGTGEISVIAQAVLLSYPAVRSAYDL